MAWELVPPWIGLLKRKLKLKRSNSKLTHGSNRYPGESPVIWPCSGRVTDQVIRGEEPDVIPAGPWRATGLLTPRGGGSIPPPRTNGRSEERRVGKECRSRWSPYH